MKLYHATRAVLRDSIKTAGLLPRSQIPEVGNGNWLWPSHPQCVYLTTCWAPAYAHTVCGDELGLLVEVDIPVEDPQWEGQMMPDEDYLADSIVSRPHLLLTPWLMRTATLDMRERVEAFRDRLTTYQAMWTGSLNEMGVCAVWGGVPLEYITRMCVFDPLSDMLLHAYLTRGYRISIDSYPDVGEWMADLTKWFFLDPSEGLWPEAEFNKEHDLLWREVEILRGGEGARHWTCEEDGGST